MATPTYWRSPFGIVKRLKISPTNLQPARQRACMASMSNISNPLDKKASRSRVLSAKEVVNMDREKKKAEKAVDEAEIEKLPEHLRHLDPQTRETILNARLPRSVQAIYLRPLRRTATYGIATCDLQLRSYSVRNLEFFADFAMRAAYYLNLCAKGPVPLPRITERWTVPRGNFIHKKSQENFERITMRRLIQIQDGNPDVVQCWLGYLERKAYYGIGMKANVWDFEGVAVGERLDEQAKELNAQLEEHWSNIGMRANAATEEKIEKILGEKAFSQQVRTMEGFWRDPVEVNRS